MPLTLPSADEWARACAQDGEFGLAARFWTGGITLRVGDRSLAIRVDDGKPTGGEAEAPLVFAGDDPVWEKLLAPVPPRFHNEAIAALSTNSGIERSGDRMAHAQYYGAAMRAIELLRAPNDTPVTVAAPGRVFDAPVGRYVHLELEGHDHRIYFEEAGQGIPLLMQHTAGCHGSQWRHLFEDPEITDHFRLIAYDLPFHGKSLPPTSREWWSETYDLRGAFLRAVPVGLAAALELDEPVFMGCSVGGLMALDLAHRHADLFRAVISVEGSLKVGGNRGSIQEFYHPQVSNEYKARMMEGLTSPTSPKAYVKETSFVYSAGWPPAFLGDLHYYIDEFDLTDVAHEIDTNRVGVHILSGEYDYSGTSEMGQAASAAIAGSTWTEMTGVGHFPMSENPDAFLGYLKPILAAIRG
jgi:pimeloyl-ACP methyl ester carboxylesterase